MHSFSKHPSSSFASVAHQTSQALEGPPQENLSCVRVLQDPSLDDASALPGQAFAKGPHFQCLAPLAAALTSLALEHCKLESLEGVEPCARSLGLRRPKLIYVDLLPDPGELRKKGVISGALSNCYRFSGVAKCV